MIQKKIHYCWFGGNPLSPLAEKCIASWRKFCPDYEIIQWNEENYDINKNQYMKEAYVAKKWGFVPDYARLDIIYEYGGIYLDTDVEIIRPIDDLLQLKAFCGIEDESNKVALGLGFGAEKNSPIIKFLRDDYENRTFVSADGELNLLAAPAINTKRLSEIGYCFEKNKMLKAEHEGDCLTIFPYDYFCPKDYITGELKITENTYTIHHYDGSWTDDCWKWRSKFISKYHKVMGKKLAKGLSLFCYYLKSGDFGGLFKALGKRLKRKRTGKEQV